MSILRTGDTEGETVVMHNPKATWRGGGGGVGVTHAKPEGAASHSPGATHQPHVPHKVTFPRLPQQEHRKRGRQRQKEGGGGAKVSRQELEKGKTRGQTSQCREVTRWMQRMKLSVLGCAPKKTGL